MEEISPFILDDLEVIPKKYRCFTFVAYEDCDIVVVDRTRKHLSQVAIYLFGDLRSEGLVGEVGIGMYSECALLRVKMKTYEFAVTHIDQFGLIGEEVLLQAFLYHLML